MEAVCYIVSLTDSVVAGNALGSDALAAIGLIAPFMSFSVFISGILSSGTVTKYSYHVGCFETHRALEYFSQGIFLSLIAGVAYTGLLVLFFVLYYIGGFLPAVRGCKSDDKSEDQSLYHDDRL